MPDQKIVRPAVTLLTALLLSAPGNSTQAAEPTLLYAGASAGQSRLDGSESFAWAALIGTRPLAALGAELQYVDLGHTSSRIFESTPYPATLSKDAEARGVAMFAVAYLPLPTDIFDIDVKAGLSRLDHTESRKGTPIPIDTCLLLPLAPQPFCESQAHGTNIDFAWGAGIQMHISRAMLRADFERFHVLGDHPSLLSLGFAWAFR